EHIENMAAEVKKAEKALEVARQRYFDLASRLSAARKDTAEALSRAVEKELSELAMPHAKFKVAFKAAEAAKPSAVGVDAAEFLLSANPGEQFRPLARIASGGELSRIMLALTALEVDRKGAPTVIFDEVDAGIGGFTALAVGTRLARVAKKQQVLCVTHLHQIAALADYHISVKKSLHKGRTSLAAAALDHQGRIDELARMIGASPDSPDVRSHILALMKRPQ
ncbi:MAG: DNA repair protein RecN, partial [Desulfomonilaceae bacterium]